MRKTLLCLAAAIGIGAAGAQAQTWQTELGFQGGFVRLKPAGTKQHDQTDLFMAPGFNLGPADPSPGALYLVVPVGDKLALEPTLTGAILTQTGTASLFQAGLRADYAFTKAIYGAGGLLLGRLTGSGYEAGLEVAGGYRFHLAGPLRARVEANVQTWKGKSGSINPIDTYGLLFGISARI